MHMAKDVKTKNEATKLLKLKENAWVRFPNEPIFRGVRTSLRGSILGAGDFGFSIANSRVSDFHSRFSIFQFCRSLRSAGQLDFDFTQRARQIPLTRLQPVN
jgi:hypothetical protein